MINSSFHLVISECFSADTLNDIQTPDLVPYILDDRFFKFKMSGQFDMSSEDSDDQQPLDLNKLFEIIMREGNETQVSILAEELEKYSAQNFSSCPQPMFQIDDVTSSPQMTSAGPVDQLIPVSESMALRDLNVGTASMPTTPQFLLSPESNISVESETSDWELDDSFNNLNTSASPQPQSQAFTTVTTSSSPQPQSQAFTSVMTSSPQMVLVQPSVGSQPFIQSSAQSSHSRQRFLSIGSYETCMGLEDRNVGGSLVNNSSVFGTGPQYSGTFGQTQTGLPPFGTTFLQPSDQQTPQPYSEISLNQVMSSPSTQPINIRSNTSIPFQSNSNSVPTGLYGWNPNYNQSQLMPTYSEPAINSRQEVTSSGRKGFKMTAAKRLKTLEFKKSEEEAINYNLNERVKDLNNSIAFYKAKLEERGFIDPYRQFKFN